MTDSSAPMAALAASRAAMQAAVSALHMALCANSIASCAQFAATLAPAEPAGPPVPSSAPPVPPTDTGKGDAYKARLHAQWRGWDPIPVHDSESESDSEATESEEEEEDNALVRYGRSVEHYRKRSREDFPGDPDEDTVIPARKRPYIRRRSVDDHWTKFGLEPDVMYRAVRKPFMGRETRCIVVLSNGTVWFAATPSDALSPVKEDVTPWRAYGDFLRVPLPNHAALRVSRDRA